MTEREQEMAITPADIEQLTFSEAKKSGYATDEGDAFLEKWHALEEEYRKPLW